MSLQFQENNAQHSLRMCFGDMVLLYSGEHEGFVFSELSSEQHNSVVLHKVNSFTDPNLPNIHFATFKIVRAYNCNARQTSNQKLTSNEKILEHHPLKSEDHENGVEQERTQRSNLVYGDNIRLLHTASKKYLSVNTSKTSRTGNTNFRVELTSRYLEGCVFKILPLYKFCIGYEVRYNDQVKLESVKTEGQFLHCSSEPFSKDFSVWEHCFEISLSVTESTFSIISHYHPFPPHDPKALRGGGVVRLFHHSEECYISAEGSFADNPAVIEDVHCRKHHSELGHPSTSANIYWQFEKKSDGRSGMPIFWEEPCRIKHLPTRCYLVVTYDQVKGSYNVTLKERCPSSSCSSEDLETIFSLFPVIQEKGTILVESYVRIKHLQTRTWLHLKEDCKYVRCSFDPAATGLEGLEWDSAELFMLTASETLNTNDVFRLELVTEHLLDNFNFVAGIVPILRTHISKYSHDVVPLLDSWSADQIKGALQNLSTFLSTPDKRENKDRQKLLVNLRVLELIIKVLDLFKINANDETDESEQRTVCQCCYGVIKSYLNGDSRKNENYLARFFSFFKTQVGMDFDAEEVMIELIEDNRAIVSKVAETELDYVIQKLVDTKDPRFMDFLANLCVCEGRAIPSTQNTILSKLVYVYGKDVFYTTTVGGSSQYPEGQMEEVYACQPGTGNTEWTVLSELVKQDYACRYLESQLNLFARICWGNNGSAIYALDKDDQEYMTFEQTLLCARNLSLRPSMRSKYIRLMKVMYVDVGENRNVLEDLPLCFVFDDVVANPYVDTAAGDTIALTGIENIYFPVMRDMIMEHIQAAAQKMVVAADIEENELLADVIDMLTMLVKYGYYQDPYDVEDVLLPLLKILNGFTDIPFSSEGVQQKQFADFTESRRFIEVTTRVMEVVDFFFNFGLYVRLQCFIYDFRAMLLNCNNTQNGTLEGLALNNAIELAQESIPPAELSVLQSASPEEISNNPLVVKLARLRLHYIFSRTANIFEKDDFSFDGINSSMKVKFPEILVDVLNYDDPRLLRNSVDLLNRYYSSEMMLFEKAIQTQLLIAVGSSEVLNDIHMLLPIFRHYTSVDVDSAGRAEIVRMLRIFTKMCHLDEEDEPHPQNQKILYNLGLFSDVLNYVLCISQSSNIISQQISGAEGSDGAKSKSTSSRKKTAVAYRDSEEHDGSRTVCIECFRFLKALAKGHTQVQERLYDSMEDLLEVDIEIAAMAEVIAEIFTGQYELCLKVREDQLARIFSLVAQRDLLEGRPELLNALKAMVKVEEFDLPVKRNQALIVTYYSRIREKENFCDHLLGEGEKKRDRRRELLIKAESGDPDLSLLLSLTDLLASCSEGENDFTESVCQIVFSVDELLDIIDCDFIFAERKRPFVRFLVSVYLVTANDKVPSSTNILTSKEEIWQYLGKVAVLISSIGEAFKKTPSSEKGLVRQHLSFAARYSHKRARTPCTENMALPFITGEDGRLLLGILPYFIYGLLPLLSAYYESFFEPPQDMHKRERQMFISAQIATALLEMAEVLPEYLIQDTQMKLYRNTVLTILNKCGNELPLNVDKQVFTTFELKTKDCVRYETLAKKIYMDKYADEIELNETFRVFVTNFKLAYQGPNTAKAQIGSKYDTPYGLPLGPSFQQLVQLFVNQHASCQHDVVRPCVERLLAMLEISSQLTDLNKKERRRQDELDIKCLQIMRAIIHNEIINIDPDLSPSGYRNCCILKIQPIQDSIQNLGNAVSRVVPLLFCSNDEIIREVLAFLKDMLYSGNKHVQKGLSTFFDTQGEKIFTTMASLLKAAAITLDESLPSQLEVRYTAEAADISIDIEESGIVKSPSLPDHTLASFASLEDSLTEEKGAISGDKAEERQQQPSVLNIPPRTHKRQSRKPAVMQQFQLEAPKGATLAPVKEIQRSKEKEIADLFHKSSHHAKLVLRVLGLMCDGQNRVMQNYLREQKDKLASINMVGEVTLLIEKVSHNINSETVDLAHLTLQTLIEMCVGNYPNQLVIYNRQIIKALNLIFTLDMFGQKAGETRGYFIRNSVKLKGSAVELLEAMLEETNVKTKDLVREIVKSLDIENIHEMLSDFYSLMNNEDAKEHRVHDEAEIGMFRTYHVLVHLTDYGVPLKMIEPSWDSDNDDLHKAWTHCKRYSNSVEVFYRMDGNNILTKIHFPFNPNHKLREEVIENVKWNISRDSPEDKLRDLLKWMKAAKRDTVHSVKLQSFIPTKILTAFPMARHYLLVLWSILMSVFTLMAFVVPTDLQAQTAGPFDFFNSSSAIQPEFLSYWRGGYRPVLYSFGSIHLILSIWMVLEYFIINWPNFRLPSFCYNIVSHCTKRDPPEETYSDIPVFGLQTIYVVVFLLCSILSLIFDGYFYCICLLHIIVNNDILQRVLKSVTKNGKSLLWVAALGVIVLYIYAVISFAFLHESFQAPNNDATLFCSTLYECFASTIRYGLIENLGLVVPLVPEEFSVAALRLFYDVSFFIIVTTIGLNIVFGIIVDTFSELRDERFRTEQDKKSVCFICSLASHKFEHRAKNFEDHVRCDHNMWKYIYLSIYLDHIDISDHNAIQKFVYDKIQAGNIEFFPLFHALALEEDTDKELTEEDTDKQLDDLKVIAGKVNETGKQLDELKMAVEKVLKRFEKEDESSLHKWEEKNLGPEAATFHPALDLQQELLPSDEL